MTAGRTDFHGAFANQTACVALACDLMIENIDTSSGSYQLPMNVGEQVVALLLMVRDSSEAKLAEAAGPSGVAHEPGEVQP